MTKCTGCEIRNVEPNHRWCKKCTGCVEKHERLGVFICMVCGKQTNAVLSNLCQECRDEEENFIAK